LTGDKINIVTTLSLEMASFTKLDFYEEYLIIPKNGLTLFNGIKELAIKCCDSMEYLIAIRCNESRMFVAFEMVEIKVF
jgi:hypothetical protein